MEASEIAEQAKAVVRHNGLEGVITVYHCKMEEAVLPEKVDLIISEWMGTLLIVSMCVFECMGICIFAYTFFHFEKVLVKAKPL